MFANILDLLTASALLAVMATLCKLNKGWFQLLEFCLNHLDLLAWTLLHCPPYFWQNPYPASQDPWQQFILIKFERVPQRLNVLIEIFKDRVLLPKFLQVPSEHVGHDRQRLNLAIINPSN